MSDELVGVVIPAFNAERTLDETLRSVRVQTHRALEIVLVDDGSTDATRAVAERHAALDARVTVLHQPNAGVAAARNAGWRHTKAEYLSFIDADDLWAPTKIERQLAALHALGGGAGMAYCWTARLDEAGRVTRLYGNVRHEGDVLAALVQSNFLGSGSNVLVRRQACIDVGGFDAGLQAAGAQGCEDWLFGCRVAEVCRCAVVPEHLVGYRHLSDSMSSHRLRMLHSHMLMCRQLLQRRPDLSREVERGLQGYANWLLQDARTARLAGAPSPMAIWLTVRTGFPGVAWRMLGSLLVAPLRRQRERIRRRARGRTVAIETPPSVGVGEPFLRIEAA